MTEITLHTLIYTKADLDRTPDDERLFFLMASSVANDTQMLNKTMAVILREDDAGYRITNQGNAAFALMMLRMLTGRLNEGWKLIRKHRAMIEASYESELSEDAKEGFHAILAYFDHPKPGSLIWRVRDGMAFHHAPDHVEAAYRSLDPATDIGDYLHPSIGNTLFYTIELLQYETLKNLAGMDDHIEAVHQLVEDTRLQTVAFNSFIFGFTLVFAKRYLQHALDGLKDERETIPVPEFEALNLPLLFSSTG
ncbi:hypothetical protein NHF48_019775 [Sphingomonas sp. H160509]|uniref:hypothetical protein n=1 Tax=Sphingomonas sp. H160509 TaxID=2955313 RepID=UPI002097FD2A|nr:hypothetical protein [Sphingomonas sp. H160509]MDD1452658.1 hypothetical protein [Sphingomonas sp. H160509]